MVIMHTLFAYSYRNAYSYRAGLDGLVPRYRGRPSKSTDGRVDFFWTKCMYYRGAAEQAYRDPCCVYQMDPLTTLRL